MQTFSKMPEGMEKTDERNTYETQMKAEQKVWRDVMSLFPGFFLMGAGSEEWSLIEMSIETATGQRDNTIRKKTVGHDSLEQRSPVGN